MGDEVLTVLLAPAEGAEDVLDVLGDLSGAELLDPFLWVRDAGADEAGARGAYAEPAGGAWLVVRGRREPTSLQDVVVGRRPSRVRLCVLVPLVHDVAAGTEPGAAPEPVAGPLPGPREQDVAAALTANAAGAPVTRLRCLLARGGERRPTLDELAREGWHNVLVAPENTAGPGQGRWLLPAHLPAEEAARLLAPQVAGIAGLWAGAPDCVFDDLPVAPGPSVRVARAFYRHIDAHAVEDALRADVLATRPVTPLPRQPHGAPTTYLSEPALGCEEMAARLWERHAPLLTGIRHQVPDRPVPPVGLGTALAWFPAYTRRAVRGRPDKWYAELRTRLIDEVPHTRSAQAFAAVSPSDHRVLVDGYRPDGLPAGWRDAGEIVDRIEAALPADPAAPPLPDDLSSLWQDFTGGALTLVDAGDRGGQAMPPARSGPARGVVRSTAEAVPGPEHDLVLGQGNIAALTGVPAVAVGDVLEADLLRRRLAELADRHGLGPAVGPSLEQLGDWHVRHQGTYAHRVVVRLAQRIETVRAELRDDFTALAEASSPSEVDPAQRRRMVLTARAVTGIGALALTTVLVALVLGVVLGPSVALAIVALSALAAGIAVTAGVYAIAHRGLFRGLDRRRTLVARVEADQQNLRQALRDYRRLRDAYLDLRLWSRAVGIVLADPFGRGVGDDRAAPPVLRDLPRSARTGRAEVDPDAVARAAATLRAELFVTGWLDGAWRSNLDGPAPATAAGAPPAGARLGSRADSRLAAWVDALDAHGPTTQTGDEVWSGVLSGLAGRQATIAAELLAGITDDGGAEGPGRAPGGHVVVLAEFLAGLDGGARAGTNGAGGTNGTTAIEGDRFDAAHFSAEAQTQDRARVAGARSSGSRSGLSRTDVLVQYGDPFPAWDLDLGAGSGGRSGDEVGIPGENGSTWF